MLAPRRRWPLLFAALYMIAMGFVHGLGFLASFNTSAHGALYAYRPVQEAAATGPGADVLVFVADGLIADGVPLLGLPEADLAEAGRCELITVYPSFSRPGYVAMFTGAPPMMTGIQTNRARGRVTVESVIGLAREEGLETHIVTDGIDWWRDIYGPEWTSQHYGDAGFDDALGTLLKRAESPAAKPRLFVVHMVVGDDAGHDAGAASPEYALAMRQVGKRLQRVRRALATSATVLAVSDHGHMARGGHGGPEPAVLRVPLLAWTPHGTPVMGEGCRHSLVDVAPTVAGLLGLPSPSANVGLALTGLASEGTAAHVLRQRQRLGAALGAPPGAPLELFLPTVRRPSHLSAMAAAMAWALLVLLLFHGTMGRWPHLRELLAGSLFAASFTGVYAVAEPTMSFSAVWVQVEWFGRLVLLAAVAVTIAVAVRRLLRWRLPPGADDRGEHILAMGAAAALFVTAWGLHGSLDGGPELGDPQSAFAMLVGDFLMVMAGLATAFELGRQWTSEALARRATSR